MTERVREILGWYGAENPGTLTNLARLLGAGRLAGSGRLVILPVDQGFEHGPARSFAVNPPAYDPLYHCRLAVECGCSGFAAPLGLLVAGAREFAGEIPLILKVNSHDVLNDDKDPTQAKAREDLRLHRKLSFRQQMTSGALRGVCGASSLGTPTMIGATARTSAGIPSSAFTSGRLSTGTPNPMQHVPSPIAQAASIRFSAANQQSATTKLPSGRAQITISVPAS